MGKNVRQLGVVDLVGECCQTTKLSYDLLLSLSTWWKCCSMDAIYEPDAYLVEEFVSGYLSKTRFV